MKNLESILKGLPLRMPSPGYCDRILAQRPPLSESKAPHLRAWRRFCTFAAVAVAAMVLAVLGVNQMMRWWPSPSQTPDQAGSQTAMPPGGGTDEQPTVRIRMSGDWSLIATFSEGLAPVRGKSEQGYGTGYIDRTGKWVIEPKFGFTWGFSQGIAMVKVRGGNLTKYEIYYIDRTGNRMDPSYVARQQAVLERFALDDKYGYRDAVTGEVVIEAKWDDAARFFSEGVAGVNLYGEGGTRYIDKTGRVVIPPNNFTGRSFSNGLAVAAKHARGWGFIDHSGTFVIEDRFSEAYDFSEGLAHVHIDRKYGFIDTAGNIVIPLVFESVGSFSEGLAPFKVPPPADATRMRMTDIEGDWGYIDRTGKVVIPAQFLAAAPFSEGLACVMRADGTLSFIDVTGKDVIKLAVGR